jgi:type IV pilus assembly protein PilQ
MPDNHVLLRLQVNQDKPSNRMVLGVPAITTRQINTHVLVNSGQTIVLGGIYETNEEHQQQGVPFLHEIPLVGKLFEQHNIRNNKRELLIFVTPQIIAQSSA